ncbi:MAG: hypothetical protein SF052_09330 [Bacteroidia bacterium]|nr:hypothetical protein [Bacteroidia bacterium]
MDENQLDKFFRDNIGDIEEAGFDESAWEAIAPVLPTLTPRPAWYRFWGNWLGAGGVVILLLMLGGMGYLLWSQNQQLKEISAKLSAVESGIPTQKTWTDTLWCENLVRDTLWMTLPFEALIHSHLAEIPISVTPEDTVTEVPFYAIIEVGSDSQTASQIVSQITSQTLILADTATQVQASSVVIVPSKTESPKTDPPKKQKLPDIRLPGIRVKAYIGAQSILIKGGESKVFFSPSLESEFVLNPRWSLVVQPGFSPMEYELYVNTQQPDFPASIQNFPGLPPLEDLYKLKEIKTKGSWILVPVSIKYSFLPGEKIQPFVRAGVLGYKGLNQEFTYELEENGVEEKRFASSGAVPWTWNSLQAAVGGQVVMRKRWLGTAEVMYSPGISVQGVEKRRLHIVGVHLGMGYILK